MSKSDLNTRQKILDKALEMFNERGIEYVGLRELAAVLGIRVGNITYYFPTKDDLVYQLSVELAKLNSQIIVSKDDLTITGFLHIQYCVFQNQLRFRCLLLSVVHIMKQNKLVAATYSKTQKIRRDAIKANIAMLAQSGYLTLETEAQKDFLLSAITLISRFWISEAAISFPQLDPARQVRHYIDLVSKLFLPYATQKARKEIQHYMEHL